MDNYIQFPVKKKNRKKNSIYKYYATIKAMLVDTLYKLNPEYVSDEKLNKYLPSDWNSIKPDYWQYTDDENYENSSSFINQFWEQMKYFSKRLREYKR